MYTSSDHPETMDAVRVCARAVSGARDLRYGNDARTGMTDERTPDCLQWRNCGREVSGTRVGAE